MISSVKSTGHMIKFYEQNKECINNIITKDEVNPRLLFFSENIKPLNLFRDRCSPFDECCFTLK